MLFIPGWDIVLNKAFSRRLHGSEREAQFDGLYEEQSWCSAFD